MWDGFGNSLSLSHDNTGHFFNIWFPVVSFLISFWSCRVSFVYFKPRDFWRKKNQEPSGKIFLFMPTMSKVVLFDGREREGIIKTLCDPFASKKCRNFLRPLHTHCKLIGMHHLENGTKTKRVEMRAFWRIGIGIHKVSLSIRSIGMTQPLWDELTSSGPTTSWEAIKT